MRTWRVGTISMGVSLVGLGMILLISQITNMNMTTILLSWWPLLFIILGVEILFYIYFSRKESSFVKYDILSVFFVGLLGTTGIGLILLTSSGIMDQVRAAVQSEEKTVNLPGFNEKAGKEIQRVVLDSGSYPLTVESGTNEEVSIFGTYDELATADAESRLKKTEDYLMVERNGDTLYISFKDLPVQNGLLGEGRTNLKATLIIPAKLKLEINGQSTDLVLKPRQLLSNWSVNDSSYLSVYLQENSDIKIEARGVEELEGPENSWKTTKVKAEDTNEEGTEKKNGTLKSGKGNHILTVSDTYSVNVHYP
ncbi:LiaF transmembrane domain-containing protein [Peribacillus sp. NPDC096540]|uniref:LiaF transmembrane domain-containing protein n=1 Tax=Peribacillus sp. NPDC096540 TaxID=3390612 RepID=UPI003D055602